MPKRSCGLAQKFIRQSSLISRSLDVKPSRAGEVNQVAIEQSAIHILQPTKWQRHDKLRNELTVLISYHLPPLHLPKHRQRITRDDHLKQKESEINKTPIIK